MMYKSNLRFTTLLILFFGTLVLLAVNQVHKSHSYREALRVCQAENGRLSGKVVKLESEVDGLYEEIMNVSCLEVGND